MTGQMKNVLDECLESVLAGRDTIDSCCSRYPQMEADLRPLLDVALMSHEALKTAMPDAASAAIREKIMAGTRRETSTTRRSIWSRIFDRHIFLRPIALGTGLIFLLSAGTALAATNADPDSFLYPLEQRLEGARTALTPQKLDKAQVEIAHANERLDETERMAGADKPEYIPELLTKFDSHVDSATGLAKEAVDEGEDAIQVEQGILSARERLDKVVADLNGRIPDELRDSVREAVEESDQDIPGQETESSFGGNQGSDYAPDIPGSSNGDIETHNGDSGGSGESHDSGSGGGSSEPSHQDPPASDPPHEDPPHKEPQHQETPKQNSQNSGERENIDSHNNGLHY